MQILVGVSLRFDPPHTSKCHTQILVGVSQGTLRPEWPEHAHAGLVKLGRACLAQYPERRPSFEDIAKVGDGGVLAWTRAQACALIAISGGGKGFAAAPSWVGSCLQGCVCLPGSTAAQKGGRPCLAALSLGSPTHEPPSASFLCGCAWLQVLTKLEVRLRDELRSTPRK